jgi:hypothetical protein
MTELKMSKKDFHEKVSSFMDREWEYFDDDDEQN